MSDVSSTSYTGMSGAGGGSMLRLTGMATGLDVDGMVKKMMAAEQAKLDKVKQDQQTIQWKQQSYQDIIKDFKDLQSSFFDSGSADKNILSAANYSPFSVSGAGTSSVDTSVATFSPTSGSQAGNYKVTVAQLAAGAGLVNNLTGNSLSTKLLDMNVGLNGNISLFLNANGANSDTTITIDNSDGTKTIGDLVNEINKQAGGSLKASFSELTGRFKLNTTTTGSTTSLAIKAGTTESLSSLFGNDIIGQTIQNGKDAIATITPPGETAGTTITKVSNNFTIDGMNYSLSSIGTASVNVVADTQKVFDKIKGFIDKYNTIVDKIQTKLTEKKGSGYKPLTDTQRSSMSESQITAWETKAKAGMLRNDENLQKMLIDLKSAFATAVSNTGISLGRYGSSSIGIDTSSDYSKPSHIDIVDDAKLKAAIASNGDAILKLFANASSSTDSSTYDSSNTEYKEDGILTRMSKILQTNVGFTNTTLNSAILTAYANKQYDYSTSGNSGKNTLPDQIYEQQLMIKKLTESMSTKQEKYYQQFSQLETAMTQLNSQQSMLTSMLSG